MCPRRASVSGRSRNSRRRNGRAERAPAKTQKLVAVLAASAIVAAAAGCVLYGAMARPVAVHAVHHPAPPAAPTTGAAADHDRRDLPGRTFSVERCAPAGRPDRHRPIALGVATNPGWPIASRARIRPTPASAASCSDTWRPRSPRRRTAAALWPTLDRGALTRAFAGLDRQDVHFDRCDSTPPRRAAPPSASARCATSPASGPPSRRKIPSPGRSTSPARARTGASPGSPLTDASPPPAGGAPPSSDWVRGPRTQECS